MRRSLVGSSLSVTLGCLVLLALALGAGQAVARERRAAAAASDTDSPLLTGPNSPTTGAAGVQTSTPVSSRKLYARVIEPGGDDSSVLVEGDRWIDGSEKPWSARLDLSASEIVAKNRAAFGGRKEIGPGDLRPGHQLVLVVELPSLAIRKVKVVGEGS